MKNHAAPIIAAILLLLPMLYVGSYLALVVPQGRPTLGVFRTSGGVIQVWKTSTYRCGGEWVDTFYWPLEQIDRRVRPGLWVRLDIRSSSVTAS